MHHHVGLDRLHLLERHAAIAAFEVLAQPLIDTRDAEAGFPRVCRVREAAARPEPSERLVVARYTRRIVVGVDEIARRRSHDLRQLTEWQDFERARLVRLAMRRRQPLVAALAIADEPRRHAI